MLDKATQALRDGEPSSDAEAIGFLTTAVKIEPDNAAAWGKLALAWQAAAEAAGPNDVAASINRAETAARRALALDPRQSDALTALATLTPIFGDWWAAEQRIDAVLKVDPGNLDANAALAKLSMSTGQVRAADRLNSRIAEREPLSPNRQFRRVYVLWSLGRLAEMDPALPTVRSNCGRAIPRSGSRASGPWPSPGRARSAEAMLKDVEARPEMPPAAAGLLLIFLQALVTNARPDIDAAIRGQSRRGIDGAEPIDPGDHDVEHPRRERCRLRCRPRLLPAPGAGHRPAPPHARRSVGDGSLHPDDDDDVGPPRPPRCAPTRGSCRCAAIWGWSITGGRAGIGPIS